MNYQVLVPLKVKTPEGIRELKEGEVITLPEDMALRLIVESKVRAVSPDCFSSDGLLEEAFGKAQAEGWTDSQLLALIDELLQVEALKAPWGFRVKDSPLIGSYWIISDTTAREKITIKAMSFTIAELRPIVEASRVFKGAKVTKIIRPKVKGM